MLNMPVSNLDRAGADAPPEIPLAPPGTRLTTLANGLTVIVREDHTAPVVSAQAWCKAGSIDEGPWLGAGLSHVLEHMLFKGTATRGAGRIDQEVQEAGGYMNAYTSFDRTVYWINVPNTGARVALEILADIMQHATLPDAELAKEMEVIRREMDMCHDDPGRRSSRRLFETAYTRSPYRFTVIGYPDIFSQLQREDVLRYYREKYAPNNLVFAVAGDVRTPTVVAQLEEAFASAKARPLPVSAPAVEPRQVAPREVIEDAPIQLAHLHASWHIPDVRHPDLPALDVLAVLLGVGRSSRLFQELRERRGDVVSIESWTYSPGNPGLFGVSALLEADKYAAAKAGVLAEIHRLQEELVSPAEVVKAVKQFLAATLATRKTMQGQAQDLGSNWLATGDLSFSERYLAAIKRVEPEAVRRVAREYLTEENRTVYALVPAGTPVTNATAVVAPAEHAVTLRRLPNGLRLLLKEDHRLPFVEFRLALGAGVLAEDTTSNGMTRLLANLLLQGTATRTAEQLAVEIESLGGHLDTYSGNNSLGINAEVLSSDWTTGLALVADVLLHPAFPEAALERERAMQLAAIRAQRDDLLQSGVRSMRRTLFGEAGYGLDPLGSETTVQRLTLADLRAFHAQLAVPENAVMAVYGDLDPARVTSAVEAAFAAWTSAGPGTLAVLATSRLAAGAGPLGAVQRVVETRDKKQAVLVIGFPGVTLHSPERFALELLQEACSDMGSRLFLRIREKLGLAYYVGASHFVGLAPGYFAFYAGTEPAKAALVETELLEEATLLGASGLTADELRRAKAKLLGQRKIARQELGFLAQTHALDELYGLGYTNSDHEDAHFEAVSLAEVQAVAAKLLRPAACVIASVLPETGGSGV